MQPIRDPEWYSENKVDLHLGITAVSVNAAERHVVCCDGRIIPYEDHPEDDQFILFRMDGDRVIGAIGINASRDMLLAKRRVNSGASVSRHELVNKEVKLKRFLFG